MYYQNQIVLLSILFWCKVFSET